MPLGWVYGSIAFIRLKLTPSKKVRVPVICVGNLTLGGVGKTPVVLSLAKFFQGKKIKVGILTRGYGGNLKGPVRVSASHGAQEVGDEPLLLAKNVPTWVSRDRVRGAQAMIRSGIQLILMDDGFQNPRIHKNLNLVVVDGSTGFGNSHVFPAGPLREFCWAGMDRADAFVLMGKDSKVLYNVNKPIFKATLVPTSSLPTTQKYFAFAGIGLPSKFFESLKRENVPVVGIESFSDHHPYSEEDFQRLQGKAERLGAKLLTTEKDLMRLTPSQRKLVVSFPIKVKWESMEALEKFLKEKVYDPLD
jgi:tetraacyldisaccharide 4'-kinase